MTSLNPCSVQVRGGRRYLGSRSRFEINRISCGSQTAGNIEVAGWRLQLTPAAPDPTPVPVNLSSVLPRRPPQLHRQMSIQINPRSVLLWPIAQPPAIGAGVSQPRSAADGLPMEPTHWKPSVVNYRVSGVTSHHPELALPE